MHSRSLVTHLGFGAALLLVIAITYFPVLSAGAVWDDDAVFINPIVQDASGVMNAWFQPSQNLYEEHYWPMTYTVLWSVRRIFGNAPLAFHLLNVILHSMNAFLIYLLLKRKSTLVGIITGLAYAVHPIQVESVAWIIEAKNTLNLFFLLLGIIVWLWNPAGRWNQVALVILFVLSGLSKSTTLPLPIVLLGLLYISGARSRMNLPKETTKLLWICAALAICIAAIDLSLVHAARDRSGDFSHELPALERLQLALRSIPFYVAKIIWPSNLYALYPHWKTGNVWAMVFALTVLLTLIIAVSRNRRLAICVILFVALIAPASGILNFSFMRLSHTADRFCYVPGVILLAGLAEFLAVIHRRTKLKALGPIFCVLVLLSLLPATASYSRSYQNNEALFSRTLHYYPSSWSSHYNLGNELSDRKEFAAALEHYQSAAEINPNDASVQNNLATTLARLGRFQDALPHFDAALAIDPKHQRAIKNAMKCASMANQPAKVAQYQQMLQKLEGSSTPSEVLNDF